MEIGRARDSAVGVESAMSGPAKVEVDSWLWRGTILFSLLGSFLLFFRTMAPTVYNLDSAEFTTAVATGGLVHATGYPLYLALGRLWIILPFGDIGFRMNLLSVVCGALTIAVLVQILRRLKVGPWAALCAVGLLASTRFFWAMALVAEVYTLHTLLMCGVILSVFYWADQPAPGRLALATGLLGLAAGNHASIVLLAPGCLFFVLATSARQALSLRSLVAASAGLMAGLSIYLYLPLLYVQQPQFNYLASYNSWGEMVPVDLTSVDGFLWLLTADAFSSLFFAESGTGLVREIRDMLLELWRTSFVVAFGPAILGIWVVYRRSVAVGGMLVLMLFCNALFFLTYGALDKQTMYLPMYVIWIVWIAMGYQWLLNRVFVDERRVIGWCLVILMAGTVGAAIVWNHPLVDLSDDRSTYEISETILHDLPQDALFIGSWHTAPGVQYLQFVEGLRGDVQTINRFHIGDEDLRALILHEVDLRPVYSDSDVRTLGLEVRAWPAGSVYRVVRQAPPAAAEVDP